MICCFRIVLTLVFVLVGSCALAQIGSDWSDLMAIGLNEREQGRIDSAITSFQQARNVASGERQRMHSTAELGASLLLARRLDQAESLMREAHALAMGADRARIELDLGNLALLRKDRLKAQEHYSEAKRLASRPSSLGIDASLNLIRLASQIERHTLLQILFNDISEDGQSQADVRHYLNIGHQAANLGAAGLPLAYQSLEQARKLSASEPASRPHLESLDELAQLYEDQGRHADAFKLTQQALFQLRAAPHINTADLGVALEWRLGRLQGSLGHDKEALAAYQRAVTQLERIRQDIPIDYDDGQSSFRTTFEPLYMGLIERLLMSTQTLPEGQRQAVLRHARDTVELIKQSELQDYLGDRCAVDAIKGGSTSVIESGIAVLYPIVFPDRIELLLETADQISHRTTKVAGEQVQAAASELARELRYVKGRYLLPAQKLYDWLLRPIDGLLAKQAITTLVVIPDASLRVVPMAVLHDGRHYAIEKYALATATGLSMTNTTPPPDGSMNALLAGASSFGQVIDKYGTSRLAQLVDDTPSSSRAVPLVVGRTLRSARSSVGVAMGDPAGTRANRMESLREALSLPGVTQEIGALKKILPGTKLLDAEFTVDAFRLAAQSAQYRIVHVASHGIFGGTADTSYIMAYDDLLTLDGLQSMLKEQHFQKYPIELLSLSACETAAGNDRAPLGISGAAMKARAKSVLGTLWPVDDEAAVKVMDLFYTGLSTQKLTKAQAIRQSQLKLIENPPFSDPFFWAPFVLIGNWL